MSFICHFEDVHAKIFQSIDLFLNFTAVRLFMLKNYPDFEELVRVIQHGLQEFLVKNIESESTKANYLIVMLCKVGLLHK